MEGVKEIITLNEIMIYRQRDRPRLVGGHVTRKRHRILTFLAGKKYIIFMDDVLLFDIINKKKMVIKLQKV